MALALGLPTSLAGHDTLVAVIFGVVLLSLLGQGLTMPTLLHRLRLARRGASRDHNDFAPIPTKVGDRA